MDFKEGIKRKKMSLTHQLSICLSVGSFVCVTGAAPKELSDISVCLTLLNEFICLCLLKVLLLESLNEGGNISFSQDFKQLCFCEAQLDAKLLPNAVIFIRLKLIYCCVGTDISSK